MTLIIQNFRMDAALTLTRRGWRVFPLHSPKIGAKGCKCSCCCLECDNVGKHPRTLHGLKDGTVDEPQIREWWGKWAEANVGIVTGAESGLVVIDVDDRKDGAETLADLEEENGRLPDTAEVETGGGGRHILFKHPGGRIANTVGTSGERALGRGLDCRGDGGYIVAVTSLHESGRRYLWRKGYSPDETPIAEMPKWLIDRLAVKDEKKPDAEARPLPTTTVKSGRGRPWLDRAVAAAAEGQRNDRGFWLACQLRDAGLDRSAAESLMREYAERVPIGETRYRLSECLSSLRSAYRLSPRQPAGHHLQSVAKPTEPAAPPKVAETAHGAAAELSAYLTGVTTRQIVNVPWPWPVFTGLTYALLPGCSTCVVGDPGVGKTYLILQCLQYWIANGFDPVVFFIEKDRKFHTHRLLAQLEKCGDFVDYNWIVTERGTKLIHEAMSRHAGMIDLIGKHIYSAPLERVTLDSLLAWIRQQASAGKRIIVVDPITAVKAGDRRWEKDDDFVLESQEIMVKHGSSLVLVNHARKGNRPGASTGHDMAGGAAYHRFTDTTVWMSRPKKPRKVRYQYSKLGQTFESTHKIPFFFQLHKTRHGKGSGLELAFNFDNLQFIEHGVVIADARDDETE